MNIEIFTVCEYAQSIGNLVNVMGAFDSIITQGLPVNRPFSIVLRIRYETGDFDTKRIDYKIINPEGKEILEKITAEIEVVEKNTNDSICINSVLHFDSFLFDTIGKYSIVIETEGKEYKVPIYVKLMDPQ